MYRPPPMNDPSSRTTTQSTPNRAAVLSPLKYRRLTCAPLRPDQGAVREARHPPGERAAPPGRSRALRAHVRSSSSTRTTEASMRIVGGIAIATLSALALAACAPADDGDAAPADPGTLQTVTEGVLTIGTSDPSYEPWIVDNDPTNGKGFEAAVAYAVAAELGFGNDAVEWVPVTFDQIIAPGEKSFDFAINQVSISDERRANLDFSASYYDTAQAVVTIGDSPAVDAIVVDLPTALYITAAELENGILVGQLPAGDSPDQFGLVLDKGSPLTDAVTAAVDALRADGTLADLEAEWLTDAAGAPVLR